MFYTHALTDKTFQMKLNSSQELCKYEV